MVASKLAAPSSLFENSVNYIDEYRKSGYSGALAAYHSTHTRTGKTSNPLVLLDGKYPFRYPSSYRRFIRRFENVTASHTLGLSGGWFIFGQTTAGAASYSVYPGYWGTSAPVYDINIANEANTKSLLNIGNSKAQLGASLAESKKTFQMLASNSISLLQAYRHAKRGEWNAVQRVLGLRKEDVLSGKFVTNKWLEYQYGWKPLLNDIHSVYNIMSEGLQNDVFLLHAKGTGFRSNTLSDTFYDTASRVTYSREYVGEQRCTTTLTGTLSSERWRQAGQIGLINPLAVAWEIVPFSFLLDWFMPVGNMLEALTARAGLDFVSGSRTYVTGGSCKTSPVSSSRVMDVKGSLNMRLYDVTRTKLTDWPLPAVYVNESPFSTLRTLNALALLRSLLKGNSPLEQPPRYNTRSRIPR